MPAPELIQTQPARLSNAAIGDYAQRVGRDNQVYTGGNADLERLAAMFGGSIEHRDSAEGLRVRMPGDFTINAPVFASSARVRFTIAHELGHYFLHYLLPKQSAAQLFWRGQHNRAETEANVFASALLMPEHEFIQRWSATSGDTWKVAHHFDVSPDAAATRALVLHIYDLFGQS